MMNNPPVAERAAQTRPRRTVAVVTMQPLRHRVEDVLCAGGFALVLIQSVAHAYLQIKRVAPDLVILYVSSNEASAACQLLSMLKLDDDTSVVPVWTHVAERHGALDDDSTPRDIFTQLHAGTLN